MTKIPFTKAHGARNDFLLTLSGEAPPSKHSQLARAMCDRHTGVGADGWYLVELRDGRDVHAAIHLYNSDGSKAELSGNGSRCVAALLKSRGEAEEVIRIQTGAGIKELRTKGGQGNYWEFEMSMGEPVYAEHEVRVHMDTRLHTHDATILNVGNPQVAIFVDGFYFDWRAAGAEIERDPRFPAGTNVSFVRVANRGHIDVRFWERGAGETLSSGTGATGAAAAAILRGLVDRDLRVETPGGDLRIRWADQIYLTGPAEVTGQGEFYWDVLP